MTWTERARNAIINSSEHSSIYIGADSKRLKVGMDKRNKPIFNARYGTVIVLHKDSSKGCQVFYDIQVLPDYGSLRNRLLTEVQFSLEAFTSIEDVIGNRPLEIHLDVNPDPIHGSNIVAKEAVGWVLGMGLIPKIKNESWAASTAADRLAIGKSFRECV